MNEHRELPRQKELLLNRIKTAERFCLVFAQFNNAHFRDQVIADLESRSDKPWVHVRLTGEIDDLREAIRAQTPRKGLVVVSVTGLEHSIQREDRVAPIIQKLNLSRDFLPDEVPGVLLIWLPVYALVAIARFALDLWSWRSGGQFYFEDDSVAAPESAYAGLSQLSDIFNRPAQYKQDRLDLINEQLSQLDESGQTDGRSLRRRAQLLSQRGVVQLALGRVQSARIDLEAALGLARQMDDVRLTVETLIFSGSVLRQQNQWTEALARLQDALNLIRHKLPEARFETLALNEIGAVYDDLGERDKAEAYYIEAKAKLEPDDLIGRAAILHNLGWIYYNRGDLEQALAYYQQALPLRRQAEDAHGLCTTQNNIAIVFWQKGRLDEALGMFEDVLAGYEKLGDANGQAMTVNNIASIHFKRGEMGLARDLFRRSLTLWEQLQDERGVGMALSNLGKIDESEGHLQCP